MLKTYRLQVAKTNQKKLCRLNNEEYFKSVLMKYFIRLLGRIFRIIQLIIHKRINTFRYI